MSKYILAVSVVIVGVDAPVGVEASKFDRSFWLSILFPRIAAINPIAYPPAPDASADVGDVGTELDAGPDKPIAPRSTLWAKSFWRESNAVSRILGGWLG
jgi:hypothetical protein